MQGSLALLDRLTISQLFFGLYNKKSIKYIYEFDED